MTDISTPSSSMTRLHGFFVSLQPNETGDTGSHQAGEIHIRKGLFGDAIPDNSSASHETLDRPVLLYHATRGEYGRCDYTYYGGRSTPESRLRRFPTDWREDWRTGDTFVFIRIPGEGLMYVLHHVRPDHHLPLGLAVVEYEIASGKTFGAFSLDLLPPPE